MIKSIVIVALLSIGCATTKTVPVTIYQQTKIAPERVNQIYLDAQEYFVNHVANCAPKVGSVVVKDVEFINICKLLLSLENGGRTIKTAAGIFFDYSNVIYLAQENPCIEPTLFHEFLHFMIYNATCFDGEHVSVANHEEIATAGGKDYYEKKYKSVACEDGKWMVNELLKAGWIRKKNKAE